MITVSLPNATRKKRPVQKKTKLRFSKRKILFFIFVVFAGLLYILPKTITPNYAQSTNPEANSTQERILLELNSLLNTGVEIIDSVIDPQLQHKNNITSALIVGVDTRNVEYKDGEFISTQPEGQAGTRNTDTIMQVIFNHETNDLFMINVPRDMGVDVNKDCLEFHGSIHWVYDKASNANCKGGGEAVLRDVVENITGVKIQYFGFVTLDAFIEVVNTVGEEHDGKKGLWIDNPTNIWEIYPYNETGWENVFFPEGKIFLSGEESLKYVRSRQITSDFGRARRQQIFMEALKKRVVSADTLLNPQKIYSLLKTFSKKTIVTMPTLEEIRAGLELMQEINDADIVNIVLDPELNGKEVLLNKQPHDRRGPYYMVPTHWSECPGNEFCKIQQYIKHIIEYPKLNQEDPIIFTYGRSYKAGVSNLDNKAYKTLQNQFYPIKIEESTYVANTELKGDVIILDYSNGKYPETLKMLEKELGARILPGGKAPGLNINNEEITILVTGK